LARLAKLNSVSGLLAISSFFSTSRRFRDLFPNESDRILTIQRAPILILSTVAVCKVFKPLYN